MRIKYEQKSSEMIMKSSQELEDDKKVANVASLSSKN